MSRTWKLSNTDSRTLLKQHRVDKSDQIRDCKPKMSMLLSVEHNPRQGCGYVTVVGKSPQVTKH